MYRATECCLHWLKRMCFAVLIVLVANRQLRGN
jgi:hypothetical protein